MKKLITIIFSILLYFSCSENKPNTYDLNGEIIQDSLNKKQIILLT